MSEQKETYQMLELMPQPAFCVKDGLIVQTNGAARREMIEVGAPVAPMLQGAEEEYTQFSQGSLYLNLYVCQRYFSASVTSVGDLHVFVLEPEEDQPSLRALALAAQELRKPVADLMTVADRLFPELENEADERRSTQISYMNRSLYQLLRIVFNMSDAGQYRKSSGRREHRNVGSILEEIFEKASMLAEHKGIKLNYRGLPEPVLTMVDEEKLERAVLNMISNAMKFTEEGGTIDAWLTRRGNRLYLSVQDEGGGIDANVMGDLHRRYERVPSPEDPRNGLGLGMSIIRSCAMAHGGVVMVTRPEGAGTRITISFDLQKEGEPELRTRIYRPDYTGERDHMLVELSDCLPAELYSDF